MYKIFGIIGILLVIGAITMVFIAEKALIYGASLESNYQPLAMANGIKLIHGFGLIFLANTSRIIGNSKYLLIAGILFILGVIINSLSTYMFVWKQAATGMWLSVGIICLVIGWISFIVAIATAKLSDKKA